MIPKEIYNIMSNIEKEGKEIYLVGGFVRDSILNKENKDYDLCTNCSLNYIKELYPNFNIMKENNHRNTGILRINNLEIEISEFRGETLKDDLSMRDFTINSLAMDKNGHIYDYFDGLKDIKDKTIRLVDKMGNGIVNDPLRILRAIRFALKYNFNICSSTSSQMIDKKNLLSNVACERILNELSKILIISFEEFCVITK